MFFVLVSILVSTLALVLSDELLKRHKFSQEFARKFAHIIAGTFIAFWPWFISWRWIAILALAYLLSGIFTRRTSLFKSIRFVNRRSYGEFFYPVGVMILCFLQPPNIVFMVAMLHFSLADAFAAIIGRRYGKTNSYTIVGQKKSIVGSLAFFITSLVLVGALVFFSDHQVGTWALVVIPVLSTMLENISTFGSDNLTVPVTVALVLMYSG